MKLVKKQIKFVSDLSKLSKYALSLGIYMTLGEGYRTEDQQYLYYNGKTIKEGRLIYAIRRSWTTRSKHLNRLAQDYNFFILSAENKLKLTYNVEDILPLGEYWKRLDEKNDWGGFWLKKNGKMGRDVPHFERRL